MAESTLSLYGAKVSTTLHVGVTHVIINNDKASEKRLHTIVQVASSSHTTATTSIAIVIRSFPA